MCDPVTQILFLKISFGLRSQTEDCQEPELFIWKGLNLVAISTKSKSIYISPFLKHYYCLNLG